MVNTTAFSGVIVADMFFRNNSAKSTSPDIRYYATLTHFSTCLLSDEVDTIDPQHWKRTFMERHSMSGTVV